MECGSRRWALVGGAMGGAVVSCERARMRRGRRRCGVRERAGRGCDARWRRGEGGGVGESEVGLSWWSDGRCGGELRASVDAARAAAVWCGCGLELGRGGDGGARPRRGAEEGRDAFASLIVSRIKQEPLSCVFWTVFPASLTQRSA